MVVYKGICNHQANLQGTERKPSISYISQSACRGTAMLKTSGEVQREDLAEVGLHC